MERPHAPTGDPLRPPRQWPQRRLQAASESESQVSLNLRLAGVTPADFTSPNENGTCLMWSVEGLRPPSAFIHVWYNDGVESVANRIASLRETYLLIFAELGDQVQVRKVRDTLDELATICMEDYPICILVPHSVASVDQDGSSIADQIDCISQLVNIGLADTVTGASSSLQLAYEVQSRLGCHFRRAVSLRKAQKRQEHAERLKTLVDHIFWSYLRERMKTMIPEIDVRICSGEPEQLCNFAVGRLLGKGAFGKVFKVSEIGRGDASADGVIKAVRKAGMTFNEFKVMKNEIRLMTLLSTPKWAHDNLTRLYQVYHSDTHVFLRMECAGSENLQRRLQTRDAEEVCGWELSMVKVLAIASQCLVAVDYLHNKPRIAHRDIKPANILITETSHDCRIKLVDFGFARDISHGTFCGGSCGTIPYMAPEMVMSPKYDCVAADVWSLGILFFDLACYMHFIERNLLDDGKMKLPKEQVMHSITECFAQAGLVGRFLTDCIRWDYESLSADWTVMLDHMLDVVPTRRPKAEDVLGSHVLHSPSISTNTSSSTSTLSSLSS